MKSDMIRTITRTALKDKLDQNKYNLPKRKFNFELFFKVTLKVMRSTIQEVILVLLLDGDAVSSPLNFIVNTYNGSFLGQERTRLGSVSFFPQSPDISTSS